MRYRMMIRLMWKIMNLIVVWFLNYVIMLNYWIMEEEYLLVHEYTEIKIQTLVGKKEKFFFNLRVEILDAIFLVFVHLNWMIIIIQHLEHLQKKSIYILWMNRSSNFNKNINTYKAYSLCIHIVTTHSNQSVWWWMYHWCNFR